MAEVAAIIERYQPLNYFVDEATMRWPFEKNPPPPLKIIEAEDTSFRKYYPRSFVIKSKKCPLCFSYLIASRGCKGVFDEGGKRVGQGLAIEAICPYCQRLTVDDPFTPDNDNPPVEVVTYIKDWVHCPHCGKRFSIHASSSWDGQRHTTCGQSLVIVNGNRQEKSKES